MFLYHKEGAIFLLLGIYCGVLTFYSATMRRQALFIVLGRLSLHTCVSHPQFSTKSLLYTLWDHSTRDPKIHVCILKLLKIPLCCLLTFIASCPAKLQYLAKVVRKTGHPHYLPKALISVSIMPPVAFN